MSGEGSVEERLARALLDVLNTHGYFGHSNGPCRLKSGEFCDVCMATATAILADLRSGKAGLALYDPATHVAIPRPNDATTIIFERRGGSDGG